MKVNENGPTSTVQISFRLQRNLVERMRDVSNADQWPPPPTQTEIVTKGIELVLEQLARKRGKRRASA
jgi:hypothetical protein